MVLLDLALKVEPQLNVFVADTELLFAETYALVERVERRYGITVEAVRPRESVAEQNATHGEALWARDPDACCDLRKVQPLRAHLRNYDAWMTALRRDQSSTRAETPVQSWDRAAQVVKTLHFDGYPSLGCTHCTRRVQPGEDLRAGRWVGVEKVECGIHVS
jgi:phosphoadenosine phosphosulfate reductase